MTAGTKIFLAIVAVLVAVLVAYYGFLMDDSTPSVAIGTEQITEPEPRPQSQPDDTIDEPLSQAAAARRRDAMATPPPAPVPQRGPTRLLGTPTDERDTPTHRDQSNATDDPDRVWSPDRLSRRLNDHRPVQPSEDAIDDGGKDAPDFVPTARDADPETDSDDIEDASSAEEGVRAFDDETTREEVADPDEPTDAAPTPSPAAPQPPQYTEYSVKSGDTMSSIASEWFGDAGKWDLIAKANPFVDPNRLSVGQTLRLPPKNAQRDEIEGRAGEAATVYVVRSGDNLSKIARAYYNDSGLWRLIYDANRRTIGARPDNLRVGMRLTIPPAPKPAKEVQEEERAAAE